MVKVLTQSKYRFGFKKKRKVGVGESGFEKRHLLSYPLPSYSIDKFKQLTII